jgi:hypothetical protein
MSIIRFITIYIFIIYFFDVFDDYILCYRFGQTKTKLTQDKLKCTILQDGGSR